MQTHFITYGDGIFSKRKYILAYEIINSGYPIDFVYAWDRSNIPEFYSVHKDYMDNKPCSGRFIWKPYVILKLLKQITDGDVLIYCDSGSTVINRGHRKKDRDLRFYEYYEFLEDPNMVPIFTFCPWWDNEHKYKIGDMPEYLLNYFHITNKEAPCFEAGFLMMKKTDQTVEIIEEWLELMIKDDYSLLENSLPQADQGVLNGIWHQRGLSVIFGMDFYGQGPFFAGRYTDLGQKDGYTNEILITD